MHKQPPKQQGLAIITVMLIIALMMTLLGFLIEKQHILMRRMANQNAIENGYHVAQGVETWVAKVLTLDQDRERDHWLEDWAKLGEEPIEEVAEENQSFSLGGDAEEEEERIVIDLGLGELKIDVVDLQGRYNLNNLFVEDPIKRQEQKRIFLNLLEILEVGEFDERDRLYGALFDWIDEGDGISANGVESGHYTTKKTPYYAADQKLTSIGELKFVEGFSQNVINKIAPYVTALPIVNAKININTTSEQVLSSLSSGTVVDTTSVGIFLSQREEEIFAGFDQSQINDAVNAVIGVSISKPAINDMMQVKSDFFQIEATVTLGDFSFQMKTRLLRSLNDQGNKVQVFSRQYSML